MPTRAETALSLFKALEGGPAATSEWKRIEQAQINAFADATLDHQFIHIDPERAKATPWGSTIAHGFLTLSLLPYLESTARRESPAAYQGLVMGINYGLDRVRFPAPVKVDSRVRAHRRLLSAELKDPHTIQLKHEVTVEIEGHDKPACVAETLSRLVYGRG
jgi:acyl dehydratase